MKESDKSLGPVRISRQELALGLEDRYRTVMESFLADLEQKGLLGKHPLHAVPMLRDKTEQGSIGEMHGSLFSVTGRFYGEGGSEPALIFAWTTNTEEPLMIISSIPTSKIFIRQKDQEQPTVTFSFNTPHFIRLDARAVPNPQALSRIQYPHPNDYIKPEAINHAIIEVDEKTFRQFQTLQFGQPLSPPQR